MSTPTLTSLDGIIMVPATPFTADNRVDPASLRRYVRAALQHGAAGFLAPANAGEVESLAPDERELVVTTMLDEIGGRVPLIGGATDPDPAARLRLARRYLELGCQGVLVYVPYDNESDYAAAIHAVGALNPGCLMVQDLDRGSTALPVSLLVRLHREIPCFTWAKVETGDRCRKISAIRDAAGPGLRIGTAGPDLLELLDRGADAYMPTLYPGIYARVWQLHRAGQRAAAADLYRRLVPCLSFAATHQRIQKHLNKAVLQAEGIFTTTRHRAANAEPDEVERRLIGELCRYAQGLAAGLG
ncbi:MAG: dihydrodipicolinate synthase family protein [Opitutaceae bacterium]|nr:dihydrodipicolinate synthase family protein [Opitutaceae bacterium]